MEVSDIAIPCHGRGPSLLRAREEDARPPGSHVVICQSFSAADPTALGRSGSDKILLTIAFG
jgi:hypothetical protein